MIGKKEVKKTFELARLGVSLKEEKKFEEELSSILEHFNFLKEVDVSNIKPAFHSTEEFLDKKGAMRNDEAKPQTYEVSEKLLEAAPENERRYVKVKAVL